MIKKMIILTIAISTVLAPAALAGHKGYRYHSPDRIVVLADELVDATRQMSRIAERGRHGRRGPANELLYTLDRLERQARHFRRDAVRGASLRHLNNELDELFVVFKRADRRMRYVRSVRLQRNFDWVESTMRQLVRKVEVASRKRYRDRRGGPHGAIVLGDERFNVRVRF